MRAIICGGRNYGRADPLPTPEEKKQLDREISAMNTILSSLDLEQIAEGGAPGADAAANIWAKFNGVDCQTFRADWNSFARKFAGHRRNQQMLDEFKPDAVVAFPGANGTEDMVQRAANNGVRVIRVCRVCLAIGCGGHE